MVSKSQIKDVKALHLKKYRDESRFFIAEGTKIVTEVLSTYPEIIHELFATKSFIEQNSKILNSKLKLNIVTEQELERISAQSNPNQVLAVCHFFSSVKPSFDFKNNFSFYLDDIRDPGNLGTILRIADWFGINEIYASESSTEIYNQKVIQSAMGAFLRVRVHYILLDEVLNNIQCPVYGAVLNGKNIYKETLQNGLIIIGNEANGINKNNLSKITHPLTIPAATTNHTESLNAAMAASIISAEFFRQLKS
jgi:TrmH family RNA methyltransferase